MNKYRKMHKRNGKEGQHKVLTSRKDQVKVKFV